MCLYAKENTISTMTKPSNVKHLFLEHTKNLLNVKQNFARKSQVRDVYMGIKVLIVKLSCNLFSFGVKAAGA